MRLTPRIIAAVQFISLFCLGFIGIAAAQTTGTGSVVGTIQDKNSQNPLPGATGKHSLPINYHPPNKQHPLSCRKFPLCALQTQISSNLNMGVIYR
jgi:hypothetical protein